MLGLVTGLLTLPVTGPVRAFRFLLEQLHDEAEAALRDEGRAFAELIDLSMRRSAGQLTEEEYVAQEAELLERLNSMREYRNDLLASRNDLLDDEAEALPDDDEWVDDESEWVEPVTEREEDER